MNDKKDIAKKAIAIGTTLSVVAGIGVAICNDGQEAQAKSIASKTVKNTKKSSNTSKRPKSNAKESSRSVIDSSESSEESTKKTSRKSSGRSSSGRGASSSSERRKTQVKVANNIAASEEETDSKRPTASKYKSLEDKKQQSKAKVQSSRGTSNTNKDENKIVITVATK